MNDHLLSNILPAFNRSVVCVEIAYSELPAQKEMKAIAGGYPRSLEISKASSGYTHLPDLAGIENLLRKLERATGSVELVVAPQNSVTSFA